MSFWDRIRRLFTSNINAMLDKAEDPERTLKQAIEDMKQKHQELKGFVAESMVEQKRLERDRDKHEASAKRFEQKARQLLASNDERSDYLAKEALARKRENQQIAGQFRSAADKQKSNVEQLKANLIAVERRMKEAERKRTMLTAQLRVAETRQKIADITAATHQLPSSEPHDAFNRVTEKIEDMSLRAEVASEMAGHDIDVPLLIEEVTFGDDVELEYEKLKAEMKAKALPAAEGDAKAPEGEDSK